jgi:hemerythrin-like domain-containing protein
MKATQILSEEHQVVLRVLDALESAAGAAGQGKPVQPEFFLGAADFIKGFADGCHHRKEENVLFKAMADHGVPVQGGPIGVMLHEHELGRQFTRDMRQAAQSWQAGDAAGRQAAAQAALGYTALLRQHIAKEDNVLFPMADRAIPAGQQAQVAEDFERVEHEETGEGIHEKYLALAESLEKQAAAWG